MALDRSQLEEQLGRLPFAADESERLLAAMGEVLKGEGLRATYAERIANWCSDRSDPPAQRYSAFIAGLPTYAPFTFMPIPELVLRLAALGNLLDPNANLMAACNRAMCANVASMRHHGTLKKLLDAGHHGLFEYLRLVTASAEHFYNFGQRRDETIDSRNMVLQFTGYACALSRYWIIGLNQGLLELFERRGSIRMDPLGPARFDLHIALDD